MTVTLGGCRADPYAAIARVVPAPADRVARAFLAALRNGDIAGAESLIVVAQRTPQVRAALGELAATLGSVAPDSLRAVNFEGFFGRAASRVGVTYELAYPDRWVITRVDVLDSAGIAQVAGAQANAITRAAAEGNALTLRGKSPTHYVFSFIAVVLPLFMLITAVQVVRRRLRRRWLWAAAALLGVGKLSLNWTTGAIGFLPMQVQLLGMGMFRAGGPYVPWVLSLAFPVGAVAAQFRMRRRREPLVVSPSRTPDPDASKREGDPGAA